MPLGLARDSMINLAEMAHQKEHEDHSEPTSEDKQHHAAPMPAFAPSSKEITLEDGKEETLVMRLSTHEIGTLDLDAVAAAAAAAETNGVDKDSSPTSLNGMEIERDPAVEELPEKGETDEKAHVGTGSIGEADSLNSDNTSQLSKQAAAAQVAESAASSTANNTSYGSYSGFSADYSEFEHYGDYTAYAGGTPLVDNKKAQPFWCCLFPWISKSDPLEETDDDGTTDNAGEESMMAIQTSTRSSSGPPSRSGSKDDDEISTGSEVLGEKLSEKDRQAVLARLRLAQPDAKGPTSSPEDGDANGVGKDLAAVQLKGLLNGLVPPENGSKTKSILKRASTVSRNNLKDAAVSGNNSADGNARRRSLFPSYETVNKPKKNLHVEFSPMARVLTMKSHKDMDADEKGQIWWQRSDYEEFRKTGRMITKAMLEGGSEIWLATNQSWQLPNKDKQSTLKHAYSLAERHAAFQKGDLAAKKEYEETRDKWWHKFGHSRRGLEHIASIDEGRQRQANVRTALRSVIEEQRRQKAFHREDPEKLRMVSIQHTSWARDLALAAGASDADAVQMNFDDVSRKSREFYLLKFSRSNQMNVHTTAKASVPAFMKPAMAMTVGPSRLDVNTVPQIRYRQAVNKKLASVAPAPVESAAPFKEKALDVPIRSLDDHMPSSMAKQAAGFASGEEIGNMSNVLTGMGAIPVVGGP